MPETVAASSPMKVACRTFRNGIVLAKHPLTVPKIASAGQVRTPEIRATQVSSLGAYNANAAIYRVGIDIAVYRVGIDIAVKRRW